MTTESRKVENTTNVVAFPKTSSPTPAPVAKLKVASKTERRRIGQDTIHVTSRQMHMRDDVSSLSVEIMLAVFALLAVLVYVATS